MSDAAKMHANFESWREQAVRKWKQYKKSKRTRQAAAYWEGYAQACANAKCIAWGYTKMDEGTPNASIGQSIDQTQKVVDRPDTSKPSESK